MKKPIIAVDIDDVLAQGTDALRIRVNQVTGSELTPDHYRVKGEYWGYYESVWARHGLSVNFQELNEEMVVDQLHVVPVEGAFIALQQLRERYDLVVVTARSDTWEKATKVWLDYYYPDIFSALHFAGSHGGGISKGKMCTELGAQWLIDDNIDHAHTALEHGVNVVLYGDYGWHIDKDIDSRAVRCKTWSELLDYFNERG